MTDFHVERLHVCIAENRAALGASAGARAGAEIRQCISDRGAARVILASAPSQDELLDSLTQYDIDWSRVTLFHMDEYVGIDARHSASFRSYQRQRVLDRVRPAIFHSIEGEAHDTDAECARYAALLASAPIDVVCLGIGENGHIAFNDPPVADFADPLGVKIVALDAVCRHQQVNDGCFPSVESVPRHAITLTIPALMRGRALFCAVPGPRKAQAAYDALRGPIATACPASILRTHPHATLYLDTDSAALL